MVQDVFIHLCKREKNEKTTKIYIFISCLGLLEIKETQPQWPFSLGQLQPSARHCRKKRIPNGFKIYFFLFGTYRKICIATTELLTKRPPPSLASIAHRPENNDTVNSTVFWNDFILSVPRNTELSSAPVDLKTS